MLFRAIFVLLVVYAIFQFVSGYSSQVLIDGAKVTTDWTGATGTLDLPCMDAEVSLDVFFFHADNETADSIMSGGSPLQAVTVVDNTKLDVRRESQIYEAAVPRVKAIGGKSAIQLGTQIFTRRAFSAAGEDMASFLVNVNSAQTSTSPEDLLNPLRPASQLETVNTNTFVDHKVKALVSFTDDHIARLKPFQLQPYIANTGEIMTMLAVLGVSDEFAAYNIDVSDYSLIDFSATTTDMWPFPSPPDLALLQDPSVMMEPLTSFVMNNDIMLPRTLDKTDATALKAKFKGAASSVFTAREYNRLAASGLSTATMETTYSQAMQTAFTAPFTFNGSATQSPEFMGMFNDWFLGINYVNHIMSFPDAPLCDNMAMDDATLILGVAQAPVDATGTVFTVDCSSTASWLVDQSFACFFLEEVMSMTPVLMFLTGTGRELVRVDTITKATGPPVVYTVTITRSTDAPIDFQAANTMDYDDYPASPPAEWQCNDAYWKDGLCDCDCGAFDPDCLFDQDSFMCDANQKCSTSGHCVADTWPFAGGLMFFSLPCMAATSGDALIRDQFTGSLFDFDQLISGDADTDLELKMKNALCAQDYMGGHTPAKVANKAQCNVPLTATVLSSEQSRVPADGSEACGVGCAGDWCVTAHVSPNDIPFIWDVVDDSMIPSNDGGLPSIKVNPDVPSNSLNAHWTTSAYDAATGINHICIQPPVGVEMLFYSGYLFGDLKPSVTNTAVMIVTESGAGEALITPEDDAFPSPKTWFPVRLTDAAGDRHMAQLSFTGVTGLGIAAGTEAYLVTIKDVPVGLTTPYFTARNLILSDGVGGLSSGAVTDLQAIPPVPKDFSTYTAWEGNIAQEVLHITRDGQIQVLKLGPVGGWVGTDAEYFSLACLCTDNGEYHPACRVPHVDHPYSVYDGTAHDNSDVSIDPNSWFNSDNVCDFDGTSTYTYIAGGTVDYDSTVGPAKYRFIERGTYPVAYDIHPGDQLFPIGSAGAVTLPVDMVYELAAQTNAVPAPAADRWKVTPTAPATIDAHYLMYTVPALEPLTDDLLCPSIKLGTSKLARGDTVSGCGMAQFTDWTAMCNVQDYIAEDTHRFSDDGLAFAATTGRYSLAHTLPLTNRGGSVPASLAKHKDRVDRTYIFTFPFSETELNAERSFYSTNPTAKTTVNGIVTDTQYTMSYDLLGFAKRPCDQAFYEQLVTPEGGTTGPAEMAYVTEQLAKPMPSPLPQLRLSTVLHANKAATEALIERIAQTKGTPAGWGDIPMPLIGPLITRFVGPLRRLLYSSAMDKVGARPDDKVVVNLDSVLGSIQEQKITLTPGKEVVVSIGIDLTPYYTRGVLFGSTIEHWNAIVTTTAQTHALLPEHAHQAWVTLTMEVNDQVSQVFLQSSYTFAKLIADFGAAFALTGFGMVLLDTYVGAKDTVSDKIISKLRRKKRAQTYPAVVDLEAGDSGSSDDDVELPAMVHTGLGGDILMGLGDGEAMADLPGTTAAD